MASNEIDELMSSIINITLQMESENEGTVVAAVRALSRKLKSAKVELSELSSRLKELRNKKPKETNASITDEEVQEIYNKGVADERARAKSERTDTNFREVNSNSSSGKSINSEKLIDVITRMRAYCQYNASSEGFLNSQLDRAYKYSEVFFSPKQKSWFEDLVHQAQRRGLRL